MDKNTLDVTRTISAWIQASSLVLILTNLAWLPYAHAGPEGGTVTGGSGNINQSGNTTTVNQNSQNMTIDWQSYNLSRNEIVNYIQPNSSSISLNRILSNNGSQIHGQINANGQVILVNPHGIFFGPTASINVGGIVASSLDMNPTDFMNGNYVFNEVLGVDGEVVNSGVINASVGGNVALIGKQVQNDGLIMAKLGSVAMASGKGAVLTFDNQGLVGVKITKEVLQEEIGVDPAVLNSGEIKAEGGRVLLTASVSQDVFSQAVNTNGLDQASSVVVHEDGTFTLGGGADVVNTGTINVSKTDSTGATGPDTARIILIGENVTSSGTLKADNANGDGGEIELHARDTTLLTENSVTSARSETNGQGGVIKVLGDKVGLFDSSSVDVSGAMGGGTVLIGGDREGKNSRVRNAEFIYVSENSRVKADALDDGDGGKIIAFANDSARLYGDLYARGGINGGNGGFIETSGLKGFEITAVPDVSASAGQGGEWLIDPYNILITDADSNVVQSPQGTFTPTNTPATLNVSSIYAALLNGDVTVSTSNAGGTEDGNITFNADLDYNGIGTGKTLSLSADGSISFSSNVVVEDGTAGGDNLSLNLTANAGVTLNSGVVLDTQGGSFTSNSTTFTNNGTVDTSGATDANGGDITITTTGDIKTGMLVANGGNGSSGGTGNPGKNGGTLAIKSNSGSIVVDKNIESNGGKGKKGSSDQNGGDAGAITITAGTDLTVNADVNINAKKGKRDGGSAKDGADNDITLQGNGGNNTITINSGVVLDGKTVKINGLGGDDVFNLATDIKGTIDGGAGSDTINAADADNYWFVTAGGDGNTYDTAGKSNQRFAFTGMEVLNGGTGIDDFTLAAATNVTKIDGGTGANVLRVNSGNNGWNINNATGGNITAGVSFSKINDIYGGGGVDTFDISASFAGIINGRAGNDVFNVNANTLLLPQLQGGAGYNTLNVADENNYWNVTSNGSGKVYQDSGYTTQRLAFSGMDELNGGSGIDDFALAGASTISRIDGGMGANTLRIAVGTNVWNIDNSTGGNITSGVIFSNINDVYGGGGRDIFEISASFAGIINAGAGDDRFNINNTGLVLPNLQGGAGSDTLRAANEDNYWDVSGAGGTGSGAAYSSQAKNPTNRRFAYSGMETLIGGSGIDDFTLNTTNAISNIYGSGGENSLHLANSTTWNITAADEGDLNKEANFFEIANLYGASGDDTFIFSSGSSLSGFIDGGGENSQDVVNMTELAVVDVTIGGNVRNIEKLIGNNKNSTLTTNTANNDWSIDGNNTGDVGIKGGNRIKFEGFNNINGSSVTDTFKFTGDGWISGQLNGGGGDDDLNLTGLKRDVTVAMGTRAGADADPDLNVDYVENIQTNSAYYNILKGDNFDNDWTVSANTTGTVERTKASPYEVLSTKFSGFDELVGGSADDSFTLAASLKIDGGDGFDSIKYTEDGKTVYVGSAFSNGITGIEEVIAINGTLVADNVVNNWQISGRNKGKVEYLDSNGGAASLAFDGFVNLTGGDKVDIFNVSATGSIDGVVAGGLGDDQLHITLNNSSRGQIHFIGGDDSDTVLIDNETGAARFTENYNPDATGLGEYDRFQFQNGANVFNVKLAGVETITDNVVAAITVNGTGGADSINLSNNSYRVNNAVNTPAVNFASGSKPVMTLAGDSADTLNINSALVSSMLLESLTLRGGVLNTSANRITADHMLLDSVGTIGGNLITSIHDLSVFNSGAVVIKNDAALNIAGLNTGNGLDIEAATVTGSGGLISSSALTISATGAIDLYDAANGNRLSGPLDLQGGNIRLNNGVVTELAYVDASGDFLVESTADIKQTGVVLVDGAASLTSSADINLDNAGNNFTTVNADARNVTIRDADSIAVNLTATDKAEVIAADRINGGSLRANRVVLTAENGIGTTGAGGTAITTSTNILDVHNTRGGVNISNSGSVFVEALNTVGDIDFYVDGDLTVREINADYDTGNLRMNITGSVFGDPVKPYTSLPADISAYNALVIVSNNFGTPARPISVRVKNNFTLFSRQSVPYYITGEPRNLNDQSDIKLKVVDALSGLSGQQLIQVETLAEIDPAIFTEVRNYYYEDLAIMMPDDQLYSDEDEERQKTSRR